MKSQGIEMRLKEFSICVHQATCTIRVGPWAFWKQANGMSDWGRHLLCSVISNTF
jgi:hypothetical protein